MIKPMNEVSIARLWELFDVDFKKGLLIRKITTSSTSQVGAIVGTKGNHGYLVVGIKNKPFLVHRIIWAMKHGAWPQTQIDHINGNKQDNRISNLREATHGENQANKKKAYRNNKLGIKGVHSYKNTGKFRAQIKKNNKVKHLGYFLTVEEAHAAYIAASQQCHGEYSPFSN